MSKRIPDPADPFEEEGLPTGMDLSLDAKRVTGDSQEGIPTPGERALGAEDYGTTGLEERTREPLDQRLRREEPDRLDDDGTEPDESPATDNPYPEVRDQRTGRLVQPDEGARPDVDPDEDAYEVGTDAGGFSAEERAVHIEPEA